MKNSEKAGEVENPEKYNHSNPDYKIPYLFYDGSKWRQDMAYLKEREWNALEPRGEKFGNKVWRINNSEASA